MDEYNVISISYNLNELDREMEQWSNLPYEMRMNADDACLKQYGCTNIDLYNRTKAYILSVKPIDVDDLNPLEESVRMSDDDSHIINREFFSNMEDYDNKCTYTRQLNMSICIALINPADIANIEDLNKAYMKFINLNDDDKNLSNSYSMCIWGYNVYNMYLIIKNYIITDDEMMIPDKMVVKESTSYISYITDNMTLKLCSNDKLGMIKYKLKMCSTDIPLEESFELSSLSSSPGPLGTMSNIFFNLTKI